MKNDQSFDFVALQLCGLLGIVYAVQVFTGFDPGFNASASPLWKFFTSIFGHSSLEHLLNNLFFIAVFGSIYERLTSTRIFLLTFLASGIFANLSAFPFFYSSTIIGASGAAMGVLAALAVYRPNRIGLALGVPLPMWAVLIVYVFINMVGIPAANNVAYEAHLFGLVAGALMGLRLREKPYMEREEEEELADEWLERIREWEEKWMLN